MAFNLEEMTVNYRKLLNLVPTQRTQLAQSGAINDIIGALTPGQLVNLFPRYYREQLPDVGQVNKYTSQMDVPLTGALSGGAIASKKINNVSTYVKTLTPEEKAVQELFSKAGLDLNLTGESTEKAGQLTDRIVQDLGISKEKAAAIVGNFMHESGDFQHMQEISPTSGRGGYGWAQWTGPRRKNFESFVADRGLDINSDEANYQFFLHEIRNDPYEKQRFEEWKNTDYETIAAETAAFEDAYERAGVKHHGSRIQRAEAALTSYEYRLKKLEKEAEGQAIPNFDPAMLEQVNDRLKKWYENAPDDQKKKFETALSRLGPEQVNETMARQPVNNSTLESIQNPTASLKQNVSIDNEVMLGRKPFIEGNDFAVPIYTNAKGGKTFDENLEGLTPQAIERLKQQAIAAKAAGLTKLELYGAQTHEGHASHGAGTETDLVGYNADGSMWNRDQRATTALGAVQMGGANRVGLYGSGRGLHVGMADEVAGGPGIESAWGPGGKTSNVSVEEFSPGLERDLAAYLKGQGQMPESDALNAHLAEMKKRQEEELKKQSQVTSQPVQTNTTEITPTVAPPALATGGLVDVPPGENVEIRKRDTGEVLAYANDRENIRVEPGELEGSQENPRPTQEDISMRETPMRQDPVNQRVLYKENPDPEFGAIVTADAHYTPSSYERATLSATLRPERNIHFAPSKHT